MPNKKKTKKKNKKSTLMRGWKIVWGHVRGYKREIVLMSVLGVLSALGNGSIPFLVGRFFDALLDISATVPGYTLPLWAGILGVWAMVQFSTNIVDWIVGRTRRRVGTHFDANFTAQAVSRLLTLPVAFHKKKRVGEITQAIHQVRNGTEGIIRVTSTLAPQFLSIVVGLVIALYISMPIAMVIVAGIVLYLGALSQIITSASGLLEKGQKSWRKAFGSMHNALANVHSIKQVGAERYESGRIEQSFMGKTFPLWMKVEIMWNNMGFTQGIIVVTTQLIVFILSVGLISRGEISIGDLIALNGYAGMVFGPFVMLGYNWQTVQNGLVAAVEAEDVFSHPQEEYHAKDAEKPKPFSGDVSFENVSFTYPDAKDGPEVLSGVSFSVREGEKVALVGESGVGKSTAIELISAYYFPNSGSVSVSSVDTKKHDLTHLRSHIAVVPQEPVLFNDTVAMNIKYGSFKVGQDAVEQAAKEAHANEFVEKFPKKYKQLVGERGIKLSVGQKQRIAIARAILRDPKILILDEPTSALDAKTESHITESLEKLMEGRTTFIIAHRLSTVRKADKIIVFDKGKVVERGTHAELIKKRSGIYKRLYEYQIGLHE